MSTGLLFCLSVEEMTSGWDVFILIFPFVSGRINLRRNFILTIDYSMYFYPMIKMHALFSHTVFGCVEEIVSQQSELAFFGARLRLRTFLISGGRKNEKNFGSYSCGSYAFKLCGLRRRSNGKS